MLQVVYAFHARELAAPEYVPTQHGMAGSMRRLSTRSGTRGRRVGRPDSGATGAGPGPVQGGRPHPAEEMLGSALYEQRDALAGFGCGAGVMDDKHPAEALVEVSERRRPAGRRLPRARWVQAMLLGSISHAVVLHAACPVVVVPSGRDS